MKKRKIVSGLLCVMMILVISGCNSKAEINVYYSNDNADAIISSTETMDELTPDNIVKKLAEHNVVSADTKVIALTEEENDGKKALKLDLSGEFKEYILMMGSTEEYMAIGSLVNTFLDAYDAESILITIDGQMFESAHQSYENYLMFYPVS